MSVFQTINELEKLHNRASRGEWCEGATSHETRIKDGGKIAEFKFSDDAAFCDFAHNNVQAIISHVYMTKQIAEEMLPSLFEVTREVWYKHGSGELTTEQFIEYQAWADKMIKQCLSIISNGVQPVTN